MFDEKISDTNFWKDKLSAQKIVKEKKFLENINTKYKSTVNELEDLEQLIDLALSEKDRTVIKDC